MYQSPFVCRDARRCPQATSSGEPGIVHSAVWLRIPSLTSSKSIGFEITMTFGSRVEFRAIISRIRPWDGTTIAAAYLYRFQAESLIAQPSKVSSSINTLEYDFVLSLKLEGKIYWLVAISSG